LELRRTLRRRRRAVARLGGPAALPLLLLLPNLVSGRVQFCNEVRLLSGLTDLGNQSLHVVSIAQNLDPIGSPNGLRKIAR